MAIKLSGVHSGVSCHVAMAQAAMHAARCGKHIAGQAAVVIVLSTRIPRCIKDFGFHVLCDAWIALQSIAKNVSKMPHTGVLAETSPHSDCSGFTALRDASNEQMSVTTAVGSVSVL
jgi:hypothetical protein